MKKEMLSLHEKTFATFALVSAFFAPHFVSARPFDLVVYDEGRETNAFVITPDNGQGEQITLMACDKDKWIDSVSQQCKALRNVAPVANFKNIVTQIATTWAKQHPGQPLSPLTPAEFSALVDAEKAKNDPNATSALKVMADLQDKLSNAQTMLSHMPDNVVYQKQVDETKASIQSLKATTDGIAASTAKAAALESVMTDLTKSMVTLIRENTSALQNKVMVQSPHFFASSKMKGTLLAAVMHQLAWVVKPISATGTSSVFFPVSNDTYTITATDGFLKIYTARGKLTLSSEAQSAEPMIATDGAALYVLSISADQTVTLYQYRGISVKVSDVHSGFVNISDLKVDANQVIMTVQDQYGNSFQKSVAKTLKSGDGQWIPNL